MLKWERRAVEYLDRHLPILGFLVVTLLVFFMHRAGYWHTSFDLQSHFYPDLPEYLHTPFYTLFLRLLPILSDTPVVLLKKLICLFDFGTALGAVYLLWQRKADQTTLLACYTLLLLLPLTIENGLLWIHVDSICMFTLLWSIALYRQTHSPIAGLLLGVGAALLAPYTIAFPVLFFLGLQKKEKLSLYLGTGIILWLALNALSIWILDIGLRQGLFLSINWLLQSPENGQSFTGILPWLKAMPAYFGYMVGTLSLIIAFLKPKYRVPAALLHILLFFYLGHILQYGW